VNGIAAEGLAENQAPWIRLVLGVALDDLSAEYRAINLIKREIISLGLLFW